MKIGPMIPEIIGIQEITKEKRRNKLMQAEHRPVPFSATMPSRLNNDWKLQAVINH